MRNMKYFYLILINFYCLCFISHQPYLEGAVDSSPPAKPTIFVMKDWTNGGYIVNWNKWSGTDATNWILLENDKSILNQTLSPSTNGQQSGSYTVSQPIYGAFAYQVVLTNPNGQTKSDIATYAVDNASLIVSNALDAQSQALQVTLQQNVPLDLTFKVLGASSSQFALSTNQSNIFTYELINPNTVRLIGKQEGRASLAIQDLLSGNIRYLGVRVRDAEGNLPGMPDYVAIGSVSEDTAEDLAFWRTFSPGSKNHRVDIRYIYLNGGPKNQGGGWRTWTDRDGFRAVSYIRESLKLGMIPFFVYYNIPDGGESYYTDIQHLQNHSYMEGYFTDLQFALNLARQEAKDEIVGFVLEPDLLGYLAQNSQDPTQMLAYTDAAYTAHVLDATQDPLFPNTVEGTIKAINYIIRKSLPHAYFGWQFNLWASPAGGFTTPIPGKGIVHLTDQYGITKGRQLIVKEASAIADYYMKAGVLSGGANFVSMDKYGLDAGAEGKSDDPSQSTWFWNAIHWTNYLQFAKTLRVKTGLPVILWQIPVGHINNSLAYNPYKASGTFPPLTNTYRQFEDSAPTYFFGDSFITDGNRLSYFGQDNDGISNVTTSGNTVTWGGQMDLVQQVGVGAILFGAGVGESTDGVGSPPTDAYWWITKVQDYLQAPNLTCQTAQSCPKDNAILGGGDPLDDQGEGDNNGNTGTITGFPTNLSYTQDKVSGWGTGAQFNCVLTNKGTTLLSYPLIQIFVPPKNLSIWNMEIVSSDDQSVTVTLPSWKGKLLPGEAYSFGFVVQPDIAPNVKFISMSEQ